MRALPQQAQGYLIWDSIPKLEFVEINVLDRVYVNDSVFQENTIQKYQVWNNHFIRIDKNYWGQNQQGHVNALVLSAYDVNGILLKEEIWGLDDYAGMIDEPNYVQGCAWECNGPNYSYRIQQFKNLSNFDMGHYSVMPAYDYYNEDVGLNIPFYMYMAPEHFMTYTNDLTDFESPGHYDQYWEQNGLANGFIPGETVMLPAFHGMGVSWHTPDDLGDYSTGIHYFDQYSHPLASGGYSSPDGTGLIDQYLYALKKYTGWWRNGSFRLPQVSSDLQESSMQISNDCANNDLAFMIQQMNSNASSLQWNQDNNGYNNDPDDQYADYHPNYIPDFECQGGLSGTPPDNGVDNNLDCFYSELYLEWVIDDIEDSPDYNSWADILTASLDCFDNNSANGNGGGVSADEVVNALEYVSMTRVDEVGATNIFAYVPSIDLFDSEGAYTPQGPQTIEPGLYSLAFKYPDHPVAEIVFENKRFLQNTIPLSSFVQATVFPVPIIDDFTYNIELIATAKSKFHYELFDFSGNLIHNQIFDIPKGHDNNHLITVNNLIPDGFLLHKFSFDDGSHFTVTTLK